MNTNQNKKISLSTYNNKLDQILKIHTLQQLSESRIRKPQKYQCPMKNKYTTILI